MPKWLKKLGKVLGIIVGILVVLVLLAVLFLQTGPGKDFVKGKIISTLENSLSGEVTLDSLGGSLIGGAQIDGLIIRDARGDVAVRVPQASVDYSLMELAGGKLQLDSVVVNRPLVVGRKYEDGTINLTTLAKDKPQQQKQPSTFQVALAEARIEDGLTVWIDHQQVEESLSEEQQQALQAWLAALDEPDASIEQLAEEIAALLEQAPPPAEAQGTLAVAALSGLDASGSFHSYGRGEMSAELARLGVELRTDTTTLPFDVSGEGLSFLRTEANLEAILEVFQIGSVASLSDLTAAISFQTQTDELGNRVVTGVDEFIAELNQASVSDDFVHIFAPDAPITGPVTASASVGGTLNDFVYLLRVGCGESPSSTVAGTASFPGQDFTGATYDLAALFDNLRPSRCIDTGGTQADLIGALVAEGRGTNPETLSADLRMALTDSTVNKYRIDSLYLDASASDGTYRIDKLEALTPYAQADLEGSFGLDGEYSVQLKIDANEEIRQLAEELGQQTLTSEFARIRLVSEGQLDLQANSPLGYVERGELSLDWQLRNFEVEDYQIGSSRGEVFTRIGPAETDQNARFIEFNADILAERVDTPPLKAQLLAVEAKGQGVLTVPVENFLQALRSLSSTWQVRLRQLRTEQAQVRRANIRAEVNRGGPGSAFDWDAQGTVAGAQFGNNRVGQADVDLQGTAQVNQTPQGVELGNLSAQGTADVSNLAAGNNRVDEGRLRLDVRGQFPQLRGTVNLDASGVEAAGETFETVQAQVELSENRQFDVSARAERGGDKTPITLDAAGQVGSDFREFEFRRFKLESPDMSLTLPEGARVEITENGVRFDQMRLQSGDQFISVEGTFRTRGKQDLRVELSDVKIGEIRERFDLQEMIPPIEATVSGTVTIEGTARRPIIVVDLWIRDIYYNGYGPFSLRLSGRYQNQQLLIDELIGRAYETVVLTAEGQMPLDLDLSGQFDVPRNRTMDLEMRVPTLTLQEFYEPLPILADYSAEGIVSAGLELGGTIREPRIELQISGEELAFAGEVGNEELDIQEVTTSLEASYAPPSGQSGGISVDYELLWREDQVAAASISTPMPLGDWVRRTLDDNAQAPNWAEAIAGLPFQMSLQVEEFELEKVPLQSFEAANANGTVSVDLSGSGTFSDPRLDLELALVEFGWGIYQDFTATIDLRLRDQMVHIDELRILRDEIDELIVASGKFPLPMDAILNDAPLADLPIDLTVQLTNYEMRKLEPIDYDTFAGFKGSIAGYATVTGTLSDPQINGRAGLFNTEFSQGDMGSVALSFSADDGRLKTDAFVCRSYGKILTATANLPVTTNIIALTEGASLLDEGEIYAEVSSDRLRLENIVPHKLTEKYIANPEGIFEVNASVRGTFEQPRIRGQLLVEDGAVTIPYYGRRFTEIQIDVEANRNQIQLDEFYLAEGESSVQARGTVELDAFQPTSIDATVQSDMFNFGGFAEGMSAYVDSHIEITGDLTGDVQRIQARATELDVTIPEGEGGDLHPTSLDNEIVVLDTNESTDDALNLDNLLGTPEDEQQQRTPTHIRVIAERGSWIRHPMAEVEITADFTVRLEGPRMSMLGAVDTIRGNASVLGKEFDVPEHENAVRFIGSSPPNPSLDILALHYLERALTDEIGEPTDGEPRIIVQVRGRARDPRLVLESDPGMTETEIIYVLMTGRAPNQAGAGEESRISGLALGAASGLFAGMLQERLSGTLPLDVVRLKPGQEGFSDARVEVGKYITEDIFVSYQLRLGAEEGEGVNIINIDYRFAPDWSLEVQSSDALTGGVNIFWDVY